MIHNPIIVALDGLAREHALEVAKELTGKVWGFKVNDLFFEHGLRIVADLKPYGSVFLDGKFHDIPNTVGNVGRKLALAEPDIVTVHASGGVDMMSAAVRDFHPTAIAAVTVLTSLDDGACRAVYGGSPGAVVPVMAQAAQESGCAYVVCSPKELALLANVAIPKITPGIRPAWYQAQDDQARTTTPVEAIRQGAHFLVMGRPILRAACGRIEAVQRTLDEIKEG